MAETGVGTKKKSFVLEVAQTLLPDTQGVSLGGLHAAKPKNLESRGKIPKLITCFDEILG